MQLTYYDPVRSSTYEYSSRFSCPGSMGPPLCLAELQRDAGAAPHSPRLVWGDTGGQDGGRYRLLLLLLHTYWGRPLTAAHEWLALGKAPQPLAVEAYGDNREMGSMVLVDPGSNRTVGAVMVREVLAS